MSHAEVFSRFAATLAAGIMVSALCVPLARLGRSFFRFNAFLAALLAALAAALAPVEASGVILAPHKLGSLLLWTFTGACAICAALLPLAPSLVARLLLWAATALGTVAATYPAWGDGAALADGVGSGLLSGSVLVAMILGHWYLVVPGLSFSHLRRMTAFFIAALAGRAVVEGWGLLRAWGGEGATGATGADPLQTVFLSMRFCFGLAAPAVLAGMVWQCVQIRSNQSATGILYVVAALVLVGEIAAHLLKR